MTKRPYLSTLRVPYYLFGIVTHATLVNIAFNVYLCGIFCFGLLQARRYKQEVLMGNALPMLVLSAVTYGLLTAIGLWSTFTGIPVSTDLAIFVSGLACFIWSVAGIILFLPFLKSGTPGSLGLPIGFASRYGLSPREAEVIAAVVAGRSTKETAAELFIAIKTVEAHLYSAYRKCAVSSRSTLINKVRSWEAGGL